MVALGAWRAASLGDVVAGATVAATSLPQYIAYAELAGLSGLTGLQTSGPPLLAFAATTASPVLSIGVTSITALMAHAALGGAEYKEARGEEAWADLLGAFAVLVGAASWVLALLQATRLVAHIPGPVKTGWKLGFAVTVVASQAAGALFGAGAKFAKDSCQLPQLPQIWGGGQATISGGAAAMYRLAWMLLHPWLWDVSTVALSSLSLLVVLRGRAALGKALRWASGGRVREPIAGLEVILATFLGTVLSMQFGYVGSVVGRMPSSSGGAAGGAAEAPAAAALVGWVRMWPWEMPWSELIERLGGLPAAIVSAVAFAAVDFLAIVSVVDASAPLGRELVGQGVGCVVSGMAGSAPVGGSLSRSLVAKMTGASSPLAGLTSGVATMALAAPSAAALLAPTPKAVLAAVVLAAVLPGVVHPKDVLKLRSSDALVAWSTAAACALSDPTKGFAIGLAVAFALRPLSRRGSGKQD